VLACVVPPTECCFTGRTDARLPYDPRTERPVISWRTNILLGQYHTYCTALHLAPSAADTESVRSARKGQPSPRPPIDPAVLQKTGLAPTRRDGNCEKGGASAQRQSVLPVQLRCQCQTQAEPPFFLNPSQLPPPTASPYSVPRPFVSIRDTLLPSSSSTTISIPRPFRDPPALRESVWLRVATDRPNLISPRDMPAAYEIRTGGDGKNKKQSMADLKLRRLNELNLRLKEDLDRPRVKVAEASMSCVPSRPQISRPAIAISPTQPLPSHKLNAYENSQLIVFVGLSTTAIRQRTTWCLQCGVR
jgi:hypothetical protein